MAAAGRGLAIRARREVVTTEHERSLLEKIEASPYETRIRGALRLVLEGEPYRHAAAAVGLSSHSDLYRAAKRLGVANFKSEQIVEGHRRIASLTNQEIEQRLVDDPAAIGTRDLAIVGGISADKVAKFESWGSEQEPSNAGLLAITRAAERIAASGVGLRLSLDVTPKGEEIDVTPD